jgi:hypothetical protein
LPRPIGYRRVTSRLAGISTRNPALASALHSSRIIPVTGHTASYPHRRADPRDIISIGFVTESESREQGSCYSGVHSLRARAIRYEQIDIFIESTTLRCVYELRTKHDISHLPREINIGSAERLLAVLM